MIRNRRARNTTNNKQPEVLPGRFLESWVIDYPLTAMPEFSAFSAYSILGGGGGGVGVVAYLRVSGSGREVEWGERLFEVGANSRLGAYPNKYGMLK